MSNDECMCLVEPMALRACGKCTAVLSATAQLQCLLPFTLAVSTRGSAPKGLIFLGVLILCMFAVGKAFEMPVPCVHLRVLAAKAFMVPGGSCPGSAPGAR